MAHASDAVRTLPKNRQAEQMVLGATLLNPEEVIPVVLERLTPQSFYWKAHRLVLEAALALFERGTPPDLVTVSDHLEANHRLAEVGGRAYLSELLGQVTTTSSVTHYADIVAKKAIMRELIDAGSEISELGFLEAEELTALLDRAEGRIFKLASQQMKQGYFHIRDFMHEHLSELEKLSRDPDKRTATGLSTGFRRFDEFTAGLRPSDMVVLAGRPGMGKSSFMLSLARHAAVTEQAKVAIFSLEMSKEQLLERLLCAEARVNLHGLRSGYLEQCGWNRVARAASGLAGSTILLDDSPGITIMELRAKARRMVAEHGLDLVAVDYLQLVEAPTHSQVREQEVAHISRSLKSLARELNLPVIALSQLSRASERERGRARRPKLSDLRESGSIEQEADMVVFIYREDYYADEEGDDKPHQDQADGANTTVSEVIIGKQRNGPVGSFEVAFHRSYASFFDLAPNAPRSPF